MRLAAGVITGDQNKLEIPHEIRIPVNQIKVHPLRTGHDSHDKSPMQRIEHAANSLHNQAAAQEEFTENDIALPSQTRHVLRSVSLFQCEMKRSLPLHQKEFYILLAAKGDVDCRKRLLRRAEVETLRVDQDAVIVPEDCFCQRRLTCLSRRRKQVEIHSALPPRHRGIGTGKIIAENRVGGDVFKLVPLQNVLPQQAFLLHSHLEHHLS